MTHTALVAVAVAVLAATAGTATALPADDRETAGVALPGPVPDVVGELLDAVVGFAQSVLGEGSADGARDGGDAATATPTPDSDETTNDGGTDGAENDGGGDGGSDTPTATPAPFDVSVTDVEECGETCRDVTVELTNQDSTDAADVVVTTAIYAGESTAEDDRVWQGTEEVGDLPAGETHTATKRVELSLSDGLAVEQADGVVTVETTIETADRTVTFTEQRQVA